MTLPSLPDSHPNTITPTDLTSTSRTTTATKHYARQSNATPERRTTATRSRDSHRCIVIIWSGPACGRPPTASATPARPVDLPKIDSGHFGRLSWC